MASSRRRPLRPPPLLYALVAATLAAAATVGMPAVSVAAAIAATAMTLALLVSARRRLGQTLAGIRNRLLDPFAAFGVSAALAAIYASTVALDIEHPPWVLAESILLAAGATNVIGVLGLLRERLRDHALELGREAVFLATIFAVAGWLSWVEEVWTAGELGALPAVLSLAAAAVALVSVLVSVRLASALGRAGRWFVAGPIALLAAGVLSLLAQTRALGGDEAMAAGVAGVAAAGLVGTGVAHTGLSTLRTAIAVPPARLGLLRLALILAGVLLVPGVTVIRLVVDVSVSVPSLAAATAVLSVAAVAYLAGLARDWGQLERRAQRDELTGLPNRRHFSERLALAVADATATGNRPAVLFCDLDRFKVVNDSLGHATGNQLLIAVSDRIAGSLPEDALAARLGGDEFAVLLPDATRDEAMALAQSIRSQVARPFQVQGRSLHVDASIGVALYPSDGDAPDALLRAADTAMYGAKDLGRGRVVMHSTALRVEMESRFTLETDLYRAVELGQLRLVYQPRVDLASGAIVGAEALLRWRHPILGEIPPSRFIPVAEETGLIRSVGLYALREGCRQLAAWEAAGFPRLLVSVNLSARQFELDSISDVVASVLRETGADPTWLELELTESLAHGNIEEVTATLADLAGMGVRCSIDDFGTGYSGLSYLGRFPLHALKIDRAFVQAIDAELPPGVHGDPTSVVGAVIALGRSFGLRVIAEGVETHEQLRWLLDHCCDELQGHLFSPPLDPDAFESLLMLERVAAGPGRLEVLQSALVAEEWRRDRSGGDVIHLGGRRLQRRA